MTGHSNSLIKTPRQLITVITLAFLVPIVLIILLATYVARSTPGGAAGTDAMNEKAIADRMRSVGVVVLAEGGASKLLQTGEAVYTTACGACHAAGVAGAPRMGDAAVWAPRIKQGFDVLVKHAIEGFKAMPARGGNPNLDSIEVARAVAFMGNQAGAKFKEPAAPAGTPAAAPTASVSGTSIPSPAPAAIAATPAASGSAQAASAVAGAKVNGAKIFASGCNVCHATGVAGAPKFGDKTAWAPRVGKGIDALTASVITGKGAMPPRGTVASASDGDLRAAVEYMVAASK